MPATTELGHPGGLGLGGHRTLTPEDVVDLMWPHAIGTYDRIRRSDSKVASSIRAMFSPVLGGDWRVDPRAATDEVTRHVADDFGLPILGDDARPPQRTRDRFDWGYYARHAMLSRVYGFMAFEQVYRHDPATGLHRMRKLAPRMPHTLAYDGIEVAADGGLVAVRQYPTAGTGSRQIVRIPVDRLVLVVHEREGADWYGNSLLRSVYRDWLLKDHYLRVASIAVDRNGAGVAIFTDPPQDNVADPDAEAAKGQQLAESYRAGESAGGRIPNGAAFNLLGVEGQLPDIMAYVRYHDEQIASSVLDNFSSLPSAPNGSRALGASFIDFFTRALNAHAQDIGLTTTNHAVEDLVDANWGADEASPSIVCGEIGADQELTALAIRQLVDSGAIVPDSTLRAHLRRYYRLPVEDDAVADQPAAQPTAVTVPADA